MHEIKEIMAVALPVVSTGGLGALVGLARARVAKRRRSSALTISPEKGRGTRSEPDVRRPHELRRKV